MTVPSDPKNRMIASNLLSHIELPAQVVWLDDLAVRRICYKQPV